MSEEVFEQQVYEHLKVVNSSLVPGPVAGGAVAGTGVGMATGGVVAAMLGGAAMFSTPLFPVLGPASIPVGLVIGLVVGGGVVGGAAGSSAGGLAGAFLSLKQNALKKKAVALLERNDVKLVLGSALNGCEAQELAQKTIRALAAPDTQKKLDIPPDPKLFAHLIAQINERGIASLYE